MGYIGQLFHGGVLYSFVSLGFFLLTGIGIFMLWMMLGVLKDIKVLLKSLILSLGSNDVKKTKKL